MLGRSDLYLQPLLTAGPRPARPGPQWARAICFLGDEAPAPGRPRRFIVRASPPPPLATVPPADAQTGQPLRSGTARSRSTSPRRTPRGSSSDEPSAAAPRGARPATGDPRTSAARALTFRVLPPPRPPPTCAPRTAVQPGVSTSRPGAADGVSTASPAYDREDRSRWTTTTSIESSPGGEVLIARPTPSINRVDYRWTTAATPGPDGSEPLESSLVHEARHSSASPRLRRRGAPPGRRRRARRAPAWREPGPPCRRWRLPPGGSSPSASPRPSGRPL